MKIVIYLSLIIVWNTIYGRPSRGAYIDAIDNRTGNTAIIFYVTFKYNQAGNLIRSQVQHSISCPPCATTYLQQRYIIPDRDINENDTVRNKLKILHLEKSYEIFSGKPIPDYSFSRIYNYVDGDDKTICFGLPDLMNTAVKGKLIIRHCFSLTPKPIDFVATEKID